MNRKECSTCKGTDRVLTYSKQIENNTRQLHPKIGFICNTCKTITLIDEFKNYKINSAERSK